MALTEIPQWGGASLFAREVVDVVTSYPRIGAACLASSLALYAYLQDSGLSKKPLDYRARLLRNPKKTLEEVLRVTAPSAPGFDDANLWSLNETELCNRVDHLFDKCEVDARVAELHESLLQAVGYTARLRGDAPTTPEHEAMTKAALTVFMKECRELSQEDWLTDLQSDDNWAAIAHFDAVAENGTPADASLDLLGFKRQWEEIGPRPDEFVDLGNEPDPYHHDLAVLKSEIQECGAVFELFDTVNAKLVGLSAASERNALQVALHTLVGITELTLHRTTAMDEARTYWLTQEASYHASRQWCGERADDVQWLFGHPTSDRIAAALQYLQEQEIEALTFIGRVKSMMSTFPEVQRSDGLEHDNTWNALRENRALVQYRRRVHWLLFYSKNFLLHSIAQSGGVSPPTQSTAWPPLGNTPSLSSSPMPDDGPKDVLTSRDVLQQAKEALSYQRLIRSDNGVLHTLPEYRKPAWIHQHRISLLVVVVVSLQFSYVMWACSSYNGSTLLGDAISRGRDAVVTFCQEHLVEPVQNIAEYIIRRRRRSIAADPGAYEETKETLQKMLRDFVNDQRHLTPVKREEMMVYADACDLRAINPQLLEEVRSPVKSMLGGEIIRLLLINAERMKLDMLLALNSMDELMRENTTTIEMAAMTPLFAAGALTITLVRWGFSEKSKDRYHRHRLRMLLRDLERTVIRQSSRATPMQPMRRASGETVMVSTGRRMGSYADLLAPPIDPHSARAGGTPLHDRDFRAMPTPRRRTLVRGGSTDSSLWRQSGPVEEADSTNDLNTFENGRGDSPIGESTPRSQRYLDLGQLIFAVWMIEHELRSHPNLLNRASSGKVPIYTSLWTFVGAVGGVMTGGDIQSSATGAVVGGGVGYLWAHRKLDQDRLVTFDTERFLTDIHELPSPWLVPEQKLSWISYLWRFYDLSEVLDPSR